MEDRNILDEAYSNPDTGLSTLAKSYLQETAKWGKFLAIVGFVMLGLVVLGILFALTLSPSSLFSELIGFGGMGAGMGIFMFFYLLFVIAIIFFPSYYLYKFSTQIKSAINSNDDVVLTEAFGNLKSLYKFWGIFIAIILGFYIIAFLFGSLF